MISLFDGGKNLLLTSFTEGEKACFEAETLPNKALVVFPGNKSYELTNMDLEVSFTAKPRVIPEEKLGGIATAAYNGGDLSFAYVNSFLEFTVSRDDISSLSFTSDAQHPISGDFILSFKEDGSASLSATQSSGNTVTFDSEMLKGTYRLAVPKGSYSSITVKMTASDGMIEKEIIIGGNFGKYDQRYQLPKKGKIMTFGRDVYRNLHFAKEFPSEALSRPIFMVWHQLRDLRK